MDGESGEHYQGEGGKEEMRYNIVEGLQNTHTWCAHKWQERKARRLRLQCKVDGGQPLQAVPIGACSYWLWGVRGRP